MNIEEKTLDKIIETGIYFLLVFTPLAFSTVEFWSESVMEITVFAIFIVWFLKLFITNKWFFPITYFDLILLLFLAIVAIQIIPMPYFLVKILSPGSFSLVEELKSENLVTSWNTISLVPWVTQVEFIKLLTYVMAYFIVVNNFNTMKKIKRLIILLMIIGGAESVYGLVQYVSGDEMLFSFSNLDHLRDRLTGTFPSPDHFAAYLKMCIFTGLGYLMYVADFGEFTEGNKKKKRTLLDFIKSSFIENKGWEGMLALVFVIILMSIAVLFTKSRAGMMNLLLGFVCFSVLIKIKFSSKKMIAIVAVILLLTIITGIWIGITPVFDRYLNISPNEELEEGRLSVWISTFEIFKDYPVIGSGFGSFVYIYPSYTTRTNQGWVNHAHNDWLELLSDTGLTGFLTVLAGFILLSTRELFKAFYASKKRIIYLYFGLYMAIFSIAVHCLIDFNLRTDADAFLLSVLTALFITISKSYELNNKD